MIYILLFTIYILLLYFLLTSCISLYSFLIEKLLLLWHGAQAELQLDLIDRVIIYSQ